MTSFNLKVIDYGDSMYRSVSVFAGPDEEHRALTGTLVMLTEEAADLERTIRALMVVRDAEANADFCPSCGCDWHAQDDPHLASCVYVAWGGMVGVR